MTIVRKQNRQFCIESLTAPGEPYEIVPGEVWGKPCRVFKNAPDTLRVLYNENRSDETFLVYNEERYSFEETYQKAAKIGVLLAENYGIKKGDRVAISMRNYPEWVMIFTAITSIGAVAVAMNALWLSDEMVYGLNDSGAKVLFADQERLDRLESLFSQVELNVVAVRPTKPLFGNCTDLETMLSNTVEKGMPDRQIAGSDSATLFYTSGSTGNPKGVLSCHTNICSALLSWELEAKANNVEFGLTPPKLEVQAAVLLGIPLFHVTGSHSVFLMSYRSQRKIVCMYKWNVEKAAALIAKENITAFTAPPAMTGDLVEYARESASDLSSLVTVGGGGAARAPDQVGKIAVTFGRALPYTGWGMTESNAIGAGVTGRDYVNYPTSTGRKATIMDLRISDEDGNVLPQGERGEIQMAGPCLFGGYWNLPEADNESFVDGWYKTGDVGYMDIDGYLYIVDRIKDLVIRGGENIGCAEVEGALVAHKEILEASVYAIPNDRLGEEVGATIYCSGEVSEQLIRDFLKERIAAFKVPSYIIFSPKPLLRIASGKIDKRLIRQDAWQHWGLG